jgi:hypothetical protein
VHFRISDDVADLASQLATTADAEFVAVGVLQLIAE